MLKKKNFLAAGILCIAILFAFASEIPAFDLVPGDVNLDGLASISDVVWILNYVFWGGDDPVFHSTADVQNDCKINISDAVKLLNHIFISQPAVLELGCAHAETNPGCEDEGSTPEEESITVRVIGNDIYIYHLWANYQCCLGYYMDFQFNGNIITAQEVDTGDLCDCYCYFFGLTSIYYDTPVGEYTLYVIGIEGDTLATHEIVISKLVDFNCVIDEGGSSEVAYSVKNNILSMTHDNSEFRCYAYVYMEFEQYGDTLIFRECNDVVLPAPCSSDYDINAKVIELDPGTYTALVYRREPINTPDVLLDEQTVIIP